MNPSHYTEQGGHGREQGGHGRGQGGHGREQGGHGRGRLLGKDDSSLHALVISDRTVHYTVI